ncbi:unnamed protein product [Bemisia tabaci]|uniref:Hexosyltransferase n=1 Tax=Bemisia tabaci TaxID=7038 RepID=A0A9P0FA80_BEMTA|nr:unnamed protein product [Bemisia tabaci]
MQLSHKYSAVKVFVRQRMRAKFPRAYYFFGTSFFLALLIVFCFHRNSTTSTSKSLDTLRYNFRQFYENISSLAYWPNQAELEGTVTVEKAADVISSNRSTFNSTEATPAKSVNSSQAQKPSPPPTTLQPGNRSSNIELTNQLYEPGYDTPNIGLCPDLGVSLKILILIISAPNNTDKRMAIRLTWGSFTHRRDLRMGFVLGRTNSPNLTSALEKESQLYGDIIKARFLDTYRHLSLKTTSIMEWVDHYCPRVKYVLKTDDDMFINVPVLLRLVESSPNHRREIIGKLAVGAWAFRNKKSKYYISPEQYAPSILPKFIRGPAYLFTSDVVRDLYKQALRTKYLPLEDVFMSGIVAPRVNVTRVNIPEFYNSNLTLIDACRLKYHVGIMTNRTQALFDLYKKLLDSPWVCG